jgi:hypothetical protein
MGLCMQKARDKAGSSSLTHVVDRFGGRLRIETVMAQEQALACEVAFLLTTARTSKRAVPGDVAALATLVATLGHTAHMSQNVASIQALVAFVSAIAPKWPTETSSAEDEASLAAIVKAPDVLQAVQGMPKDAGSVCAAARLAFGMTVVAYYEKADTEEVAMALSLIADAVDASAFGCLVCSTLLSCPCPCNRIRVIRCIFRAVGACFHSAWRWLLLPDGTFDKTADCDTSLHGAWRT